MHHRHLPDGTLPWTRSCLVCGEHNPRGFKLKSRLENGAVVIDYTTRPEDVGYKTVVHGGVLMTLIDEAMTWAAIIETKGVCVAAEMTTRLTRPTPVGTALRIAAKIERNARRLILTSCSVTGPDGAVYAEATGKYVPAPPDSATLHAEDFVHSKTTIPPEALLGP